nr:MAG TPA: hypothetical protein [Caudoviricetes sp.]
MLTILVVMLTILFVLLRKVSRVVKHGMIYLLMCGAIIFFLVISQSDGAQAPVMHTA